jgi:hypothetical protein
VDEGGQRLQESFSAQGYAVLRQFLANHEIDVLDARRSGDAGADGKVNSGTTRRALRER